MGPELTSIEHWGAAGDEPLGPMRENKLRDSKLGTWLVALAVAGAASIHAAPTARNAASAVQPKGATAMCSVTRNVRRVRITAPASLRREATTSKLKRDFMVPPPPPTPCVLPPGFDFSTMEPAQQNAVREQELREAQTQDSPKTHNESAAREQNPQQSDQELQNADEELQAALRSSLLTADLWKR